MRVESSKSFIRSLGRRSDGELQAVADAMNAAAERFGRPKVHSGADIRRLGRNLFGCRVGLDLRLLFKREAGTLVFVHSGNHDDIQAYLGK
jgi:hypothetical protein